MQGEECAQSSTYNVEVSQHNEDNIGIDMQSLHIEQVECNNEDEEVDDEEEEDQPVPASWIREDLGYIGVNECHDTVWFYGDGPINKGAMFSMKFALHDAVKSWLLKLQRQFNVLKSSPAVYTMVGKTEGCNFRVHGHVPKYESYWLVSRVEEHNCMLRNTRSSHRNLTATYVANKTMTAPRRPLRQANKLGNHHMLHRLGGQEGAWVPDETHRKAPPFEHSKRV
uniref:Uncharacterized protein n=1 Tax=Oryza punctata TaxID=4537 RepID=A0A0E0L0T4_ORYPU